MLRRRSLIASKWKQCWLQWNAATECNVMLPLAAFPMHYYPAAGAIQPCHLIRGGLDCQIPLSAAAWRLQSEKQAVRCGLPVIRPELEDWDSSISPSALAERLGYYSLTYKLSSSVDIFLVCGGRA
jgi:hypothetical protein